LKKHRLIETKKKFEAKGKNRILILAPVESRQKALDGFETKHELD
jgi:hypothetical protein